MIKPLVLASIIAVMPPSAWAAAQSEPVFVQIIVKACRPAETPLEPINQGESYDDEKPPSAAERKQLLVELGCIDVPMPMEWVSWPMTPTVLHRPCRLYRLDGVLAPTPRPRRPLGGWRLGMHLHRPPDRRRCLSIVAVRRFGRRRSAGLPSPLETRREPRCPCCCSIHVISPPS